MGGTTAKASMIENSAVAYSSEYEVGASISMGNRLVGGGGELIRAPSIDIAEVGSGGGSIAYLDGAGGLRVGPRSAGAVPGPACYQRGGVEPTVTDANVVLGYIRPGELADGEVSIDIEAAQRAVHDQIAVPLGMDLLQAAEGIHRIANARTMRALRAVSTERGRDPREFVLMAFGGSGPIHAAGLANELLIRQIIVPPLPGLFSTLGLLFSGVEHHDVRSCLLSGETLNARTLEQIKMEMQRNMLAQFETEGYPANQVMLSCSVDIRFKGQASEIRIPVVDEHFTETTVQTLYITFETEHERLYGHRSDPDNPVEVVAVRLIGQAGIRGQQGVLNPAERLGARALSREAYFGASWGTIDTPVISRRDLGEEGTTGPLLIDEYDSTIVVPPDYRGFLDSEGNILMSPVGTG
jgi:N-methylhydantoinase A